MNIFCCGSRRKDPSETSGVGLLFEELEEGGLVVAQVLEGGPAWKTGKIAAGDVLYEVDSVQVFHSDAREVRDLVLGPEGTSVLMGFKRGQRYESDPVFYVKLRRVHGVPGVGHFFVQVERDGYQSYRSCSSQL